MLLTVDIPDATLDSLQLAPADLHRELQCDLAVALYSRGVLPVGKAMALAGVTRREFDGLLSSRAASRPFDDEELNREVSGSDFQ